ncbi:HAD family phosphatase [Microbacterium mitrae]|uniref:HAD family phosphatase n=2 Tax=Microbacterium mitrae TaxID=664640 RepID=A0A5C8HR97_9MICO|nr:HAD family phosphatase [Microbacterium mitrae]TXK06656.1 HAD family phosphatase [Microbacterium mitrae]
MRAVLWDMDGTLVDTEPYWMRSEEELVGEFGGHWTDEDAKKLVGLGLDTSARILQGAGVRMDEDAIINHLTDQVTYKLATEGVPFRPGARELLADLKAAGIKTALVTMSLRRMAAEVVNLIDFDAFNVIFAGDDVTRPKPFADPYLMACEALQVRPDECVALEDSPNGVASAVAADIVTIGIPHIVSLDDSGATGTIPTLVGVTAADLIAFHERHTS